jgi:hypothetical protein
LNLIITIKPWAVIRSNTFIKKYYAYPEDLRGSPPEFLPVGGCNLKGQPIVADL